ncbi:hypothetical protein GCM10011594_41700 [Nakamurella endophytica]|uniref:Uncharacterized protein n=1 Tax=Nakamurella endophytica TaxID=1748367 RepID=A0A917TB84_9ACTN|nr:hypothetical protein GCM10011594_41700 [Nakamurella endophytica]
MLVKSAPWSEYSVTGILHTGHRGSVLRQIACRRANAVCTAVGLPRNTVYPATAREWSSKMTVNAKILGNTLWPGVGTGIRWFGHDRVTDCAVGAESEQADVRCRREAGGAAVLSVVVGR